MPSPLEIALSGLAKELRQASVDKEEIERAWRKGDLSYKFWDVQKQMAQTLSGPGSLKKVLNCARRIRKTSTALTKSIEDLVVNEGPPIRFVAPTQKMLRKIVHPLIKLICLDAPRDLKPIWKSQDGFYLFPSTGSELHLAGANNGHEDDSRGVASRRCVVDEAQMIDHLKYLVEDVLMPQLITTGGQLWMLLTPPKTPVHECAAYVQEAGLKPGSYAEFDIYQSEYAPSVIEEFCKEAGGPESTTWQREYMCKFVVDKNFAIIPEWKDAYVADYVPDEFYQFYALYEGMDIGVRDLTVNLFGVYDFKQAKLFVQDEFVINGPQMTTKKVAEGVAEKEKDLWKDRKPKLRVADNSNLILLQDLGLLHGLHFAPTSKDTLEAMVNYLRLLVSAGRVVVSPRCAQLIGCLKYGVWNDKRTDFETSGLYGHFDALAALIYMVRNIDVVTNPVPANYGLNPATMHINQRENLTHNQAAMKKALLGRRK